MRHDHFDPVNGPSSLASPAELGELLRRNGDRLVLAESCTCGLAAAQLGGIPGISEVFCGSMVVYRTPSKRDWLNLDPAILDDPEKGPVSMEASRALARAILEKTPEATLAAAVTGHLGPDSPNRDGQIFVAIVYRSNVSEYIEQAISLQSPSPISRSDSPGRQRRQQEAADWFLASIARAILNRTSS